MFLKKKPNIRLISEGSCDTEDWSYDAENSALTSHEKKKKIKMFYLIHASYLYSMGNISAARLSWLGLPV